jgi:pyruvate formate lyase activating enzyme
VLAEIARDTIFYDQSGGGVTFSGGEPLGQPAFLGALLTGCRERGLRTCVDTSGLAPAATLLGLARDVDLFLYDLKVMDPDRHRRFTGAENALILSNLQALLQAGGRVTVRIPVVTGVNDDLANIDAAGRFLASSATRPDVVLLPYHRTGEDKYARMGRTYRLAGIAVPDAGKMAELAARLGSFGLKVQIGG